MTNAGIVSTTLYDRYVRDFGCVNTTFIVPRDTNTLARLVELVIRPGDVVLDLGCGDGIATAHAAACGAAHVIGIDVNADAVSNARRNAQCLKRPVADRRDGASHPPGIVTIEKMDMRALLTDAAAREGLLERCGLGGRDIDVVISNPPYVPMRSDLAWQPSDVKAIRALPARDLGVLGRSDALLDRVGMLRAAMIAAEDGGPDGLRFVREMVAHGPTFADRVAWVQASYSSPMTMLESLERASLSIETLVAYATPFGGSATDPGSAQHAYLSAMRENGDAYFWSASDGARWMLLLGLSARRGPRPPNYDPPAIRASLRRLLSSFAEHGPDAVSHWREEMPFEIELGRYVA